MTAPTEEKAAAKSPAAPTPRHRRIWSAVFADLSAWVETHGDVPKRRSKDAEEYRLANWLNVQRSNHRSGKLHQDYIDQLETVPGALETRPTRTHREWAEAVADFHRTHGRLPGTGADDKAERSLGHYLADRLRPGIRSGAIKDEDFAPIAAIAGTVAPARERKSSETYFRELKEYTAANGRMPGWQDARPLARWVRRVMTADSETTYVKYRDEVTALAAGMNSGVA